MWHGVPTIQRLPEEVLVRILFSLDPDPLIGGDEDKVLVQRPRLSSFYFSAWDDEGTGSILYNPAALTCKQWMRILSDKPFVCDIYLLFERGSTRITDKWEGQRLARWLSYTGTTLLNVYIWNRCHSTDMKMGHCSDIDNLLSNYIPRIIALSYQGPDSSFILSVFESAESRHEAAPPCRAGELERFNLNGLIKGISPAPVLFPKLEFISFDIHWDVLSVIDAPCLTSLNLPRDSELSLEQLQQLAVRFPSLEDLEIPPIEAPLGVVLYLSFKKLRRLTATLPDYGPRAADYLSVGDHVMLDTLTVRDTGSWTPAPPPWSISSIHLTTFTFIICNSGSRLDLDPNIFSSLPNLENFHLERDEDDELEDDSDDEEEEIRAHNDMVLSALLKKSHPDRLLPCPGLVSLKGNCMIVNPSLLLEILRERRRSPTKSPRGCILTWSWGEYFPDMVEQDYEQFAPVVRDWLQLEIEESENENEDDDDDDWHGDDDEGEVEEVRGGVLYKVFDSRS